MVDWQYFSCWFICCCVADKVSCFTQKASTCQIPVHTTALIKLRFMQGSFTVRDLYCWGTTSPSENHCLILWSSGHNLIKTVEKHVRIICVITPKIHIWTKVGEASVALRRNKQVASCTVKSDRLRHLSIKTSSVSGRLLFWDNRMFLDASKARGHEDAEGNLPVRFTCAVDDIWAYRVGLSTVSEALHCVLGGRSWTRPGVLSRGGSCYHEHYYS